MSNDDVTFEEALQSLINRYSKENGSDTPDFILAKYLADCLAAWNSAVKSREKWYGREPKPVPQSEWPTDAQP